MIAYLYLHPDNFAYNKNSSREEVINRLKALVMDMAKVIKAGDKDNKFVYSLSFLMCSILPNISILQIGSELTSEERDIFYGIIDKSEYIEDISIAELQARCMYQPQEEVVNTMLVLNVPDANITHCEKELAFKNVAEMQFHRYEVVYSRNSWIHLRRQILGNHPGTPEEFISDSSRYFDNIHFHKNCKLSLTKKELDPCPRKWVKYLSALNDCWHYVWAEHENNGRCQANDVLEDLSGRCHLDRGGSIEGNPDKKDDITFLFECNDKKTSTIPVYCELHLKITSPDDNYNRPAGFNEHFNPRLYFAAPRDGVAGGKILVGSIGPHL